MRLAPSLLLILCAAAVPADVLGVRRYEEPERQGDARVGVVVDRQGAALVRPLERQRWTPLRQRDRLLPGDRVRTSPRGANAVEIRIAGGGSILLGPGGLIELPKKGAVRLHRGELEVRPAKGGPLHVRGPGGYAKELGAKTVLQSDGKATRILAKKPRWLRGYRESTTDEWMGSLVAKVDGRNVPLTVGYHKVDVDIHDQIARTTVEQSFQNTTKSRLEGVFYFPLPADASISGFAMWIGNELVEADIVEKQRARAIFEDILRRRKDPALLEWTGGNMFKARVFPIEPHSEKRIRIRYTQVLPLQGKTIRYRYGLRSELLRNRPLRELRLRVAVSSTTPLLEVESPTHEVTVRKTAGTAIAEFEAEEYTPERDFELAIEVDRSQAVTVVPHRRGDDGYFMLLLAPPGSGAGAMQRELTAESGPLHVTFLADTSGSMHRPARQTQADFIAGLLDLLGEKDRFRLLTCDIDVQEFRDAEVAVTDDNKQAALAFLRDHDSLGWTDLDQGMKRALDRARPDGDGRHLVIYVGDGIGTTGDADPVALARRLQKLGADAGVCCHAVSTSSTFEKAALEAIASIGGGTVRTADDQPLQNAYDLLAEAAQPTIKDLRVEFEGFRTARVYPETLPNLPATSQQVILGRYLPTGETQRGRATITGTLDGKPVRYSAKVLLPAADAGNSFLPRLWARRHLDALLAQGRTPRVKDDIVAFSEEFGIMTPYTSFLVLENDEDRKRYGVERRVSMRDGERFFAAGKNKAETELLREQMRRARKWRLDLRARMLREIARLGRDLHNWNYAYGNQYPGSSGRGKKVAWYAGRSQVASEPMPADLEGEVEELDALDLREDAKGDPNKEMPAEEPIVMHERMAYKPAKQPMAALKRSYDDYFQERKRIGGRHWLTGKDEVAARRTSNAYDYRMNSSSLHFPALPAAPSEPKPVEIPAWPAEVLAAVRQLDRKEVLDGLQGGLDITLDQKTLHRLRDYQTQRYRSRTLLSARAWYVRTSSLGQQPIEHWFDGETRAIVAGAFRLGRRRAATKWEHLARPSPVAYSSPDDFFRRYRNYTATVASRQEGRLVVVFEPPKGRTDSTQLTFDTEKGVVAEVQSSYNDKLHSKTTYSKFVNLADRWWPTRVETFNKDGRQTNQQTLTFAQLTRDDFQGKLRELVSAGQDILFLTRPDPKLADARQAIHEKRGQLEDHLVLVLHHCTSQQWDKAWKAFAELSTRAKGKQGIDWLRTTLLSWSRRGAESKKWITELGSRIAKAREPSDKLFLSQHLLNTARSVLQVSEVLVMHDRLRPIYFGDGDDAQWRQHAWLTRQAGLLQSAGRTADALAVWERLAREHPYDMQAVFAYMSAVGTSGDIDKAIAIARRALANRDWWEDHEAQQMYQRLTQQLWDQRHLRQLEEVLVRWLEERPKQITAYQRYLSVLMFLGREKVADAWIRERFAETLSEEADQAQDSRLRAAVQMALGQGWNFYTYYMDPRWAKPMAALAYRLAGTRTTAMHLVSTILANSYFRRTDEYAELRRKLAGDLVKDGAIEKMDPTRLQIHLGWIDWSRAQIDQKLWRDVTDRVVERYGAAEKDHEVRVLANQVLRLLDQHGEKEEAIDFLRARLERDSATLRPEVANLLFARLLGQPWTTAIEAELFALVSKLDAPKADDKSRRTTAATTIRRLAEGLYAMHFAKRVGPAAEREKLPRAELRERMREARLESRRALTASFAAAAAKADAISRPWFEIERLCFAAETGVARTEIDGETREFLFSLNGKEDDQLSRILRERCSLVLSYGALRDRKLADGVLELYRTARAQHADLLDWRYQSFRLMVALDRTADLEKELRSWVVPAKVDSRWRIALGYLLAETDRLEEAIEMFERVAAIEELEPADYAALGNWYLVMADDAKRHEAVRAQYAEMPENVLANRLYKETNKLSRNRQGGLPPDFDPETLKVLEALLRKATYPANYLSQVQHLYNTVKDFRVLACMVDGVTGHSPQKVYPYLQRVIQIVNTVHEEATCDELATRVKQLREKIDNPVDRRALLLIEATILRRAAEVKNQPGQHIGGSLAALQAAFKGSWSTGEPRLMAQYLAALGRIPHGVLAAEQQRQLRALDRLPELSAFDRFEISRSLANVLWSYTQYDAAIDHLTAALSSYRAAKGELGAEANNTIQTLASWLRTRKRFLHAESLLLSELSRQKTRGQRDWLNQQLFDVYIDCLQHGGTVAIGSGRTLYDFARGKLSNTLFKTSRGYIQNLLYKFVRLHEVAHKKGIEKAGADLLAFAESRLDELATLEPNNSQNMFSNVANALHRMSGPVPALRLLVRRLETEPGWLSRVSRGGWQSFGYQVARYRYEARNTPTGTLEPRLLKLVLRELERDLTSMRTANRTICQAYNTYFWKEQQPEFERVAFAMIERHKDSPARILYAADYLWNGLRLHGKAIEVLQSAELRGKLREDGRYRLVGWLHNQRRWAESIPVLHKLVAAWPDKLHYRVSIVRALHETGQDAAALAMVDATEKRFGRGKANVLASLGSVCLDCGFFARSAGYYEVLIPLHQRTHRNRGVGDGTLSSYYGQLARAWAGAKQPDKAVDAAAAAVVAWGPTHGNRRSALAALTAVIQKIPDLNAYAKRWDDRVRETGMDAAVIRKAMGIVYLERKEATPAIHHLRLARALQPLDKEIHTRLLGAYDLARDARGATAALIEAIHATPMDLNLYQNLGQRLQNAGDSQEAERAWTTLVELQPNEAESHRRLAQHRERQRRYADAAVQWRQVVRIRTNEPAGWLSLAEVLIKAGDHDAARKALKHVMDTKWERRFGNVRGRAANLLRRIEALVPPK